MKNIFITHKNKHKLNAACVISFVINIINDLLEQNDQAFFLLSFANRIPAVQTAPDFSTNTFRCYREIQKRYHDREVLDFNSNRLTELGPKLEKFQYRLSICLIEDLETYLEN